MSIPGLKLIQFERLVDDYRIALEDYRAYPFETRFVRKYLKAYQNLVDFVNSLLDC